MEQLEGRARKYVASVIEGPALREAVAPKSRCPCKGGLVSDDFCPALTQEHVELVPEGLAEVRPKGITTTSGRGIDCDVIAYCTGCRILDFDRIDARGEGGVSLAKQMEAAPEA